MEYSTIEKVKQDFHDAVKGRIYALSYCLEKFFKEINNCTKTH